MILTHCAIPLTEPFCGEQVFSFLARRAIAGVETAGRDGGRHWYARTVRLPGGPGAISVSWEGGDSLRVSIEATAESDVATARAMAQRIFDTGAPAPEIDAALRADPAFALQVARAPGVRVPGAVDLHEITLRAIIGQQISVARAAAHLARLTGGLGARYSTSAPEIFGGLDLLFPAPEAIAEHLPVPGAEEQLDPERLLRLPRRSTGAVVAVSRALAAGDISAADDTDPREFAALLRQSPGIGPWTAHYIAMRFLAHRDAWLPGDVALLAGARKLGILPNEKTPGDHRELERISARWAPWRAYAAMRLWYAPAQ